MKKNRDVAQLIGRRIREARRLAGLTQIELAQKLNESTGRIISEWEHARCSPSGPKILGLAKALGVTPNYLYEIECGNGGLSLAESRMMEKIRTLDADGQRAIEALLEVEHERCTRQTRPPEVIDRATIKLRYIPQAVSAGLGAALQEEQVELIDVPLSAESVRADFTLPVSGNSMEPEFHNGDLLLVQQTTEVAPGQLGVFGVDGEGYFKKLGQGELLSLNPAYRPIPLGGRDVHVFGRVLGTVPVQED